jgi:hypothetical protein
MAFVATVLHYLCDFALQSEFMAKGKNRFKPLAHTHWFHPMMAHCAVHGGSVYLLTGSVGLGLLETVAHFAIDYSKCGGRFGEHVDQALHIACKVLWVTLVHSFPGLIP